MKIIENGEDFQSYSTFFFCKIYSHILLPYWSSIYINSGSSIIMAGPKLIVDFSSVLPTTLEFWRFKNPYANKFWQKRFISHLYINYGGNIGFMSWICSWSNSWCCEPQTAFQLWMVGHQRFTFCQEQ
jgi:hypothetical protein